MRTHTQENVPSTMKAAAIDRYGPPSVLKVHELPTPEPDDDQILIALHTSGVGSWDAEMREGEWRPPGRSRFPRVLGLDGSGVVAAKGKNVRRFAIGDRVWAYELAFAGGRELEQLLDVLERGARVVYPNGVEPEPKKRAGIRVKSYDAAGGAKEFARLKRASEQAKLRVPIDGKFALARASAAHRRVEHGHVLGRVVLSWTTRRARLSDGQ